MGNGVAKLGGCCPGPPIGDISSRYGVVSVKQEDLGHSFCYVRQDENQSTAQTAAFRSISGAAVSANPSTAASDACPYSSAASAAAAFKSSELFASLPLQPVPRGTLNPFPGCVSGSGPIERGFLSGPIERGLYSSPIERGLYSGPIEKKGIDKAKFGNPKTFSHRRRDPKTKSKEKARSFFKTLLLSLIPSKNNTSWSKKSMIKPINGSDSVTESGSEIGNLNHSNTTINENSNTITDRTSEETESEEDDEVDEAEEEESCEFSMQNLQWAQGRAGEDRMHVVVSELDGSVFVGIYDGFNGPDAPDYLLNNLYTAVHKEINGLLWNEKSETLSVSTDQKDILDETQMRKQGFDEENRSITNGDMTESCCRRKNVWKCNLDKEKSDQLETNNTLIDHGEVLEALMQALKKTEEAYLEVADKKVMENPELALMGSCVLVMLMRGEDVYLMNVGDSRAVLAQKSERDLGFKKRKQELERIKEEGLLEGEAAGDESDSSLSGGLPSLIPLQLTDEHSTRIHEEVRRIRKEHPDDVSAVENERVKGYLKVTRAFGAGFLKQPKWNDALLEMFRIDYVGNSPYITCSPSLHHHRLTLKDKFLILSSDGLYEYFSNEEVVFEVESFIAAFPEGDPAQHLIEEVLFRAAKKFGIDFHELLEIPQGDRRRYHDDVSVIILSLEGRIWGSSM